MKKNLTLVVIVLVVVGGFFVWQYFRDSGFDFPLDGPTGTETIVVDNDGQVIGTADEFADVASSEGDSPPILAPSNFTTKEIMITNGLKHSIPLDDIIGGGPPKDGIPSIDQPKFVSVQEASDWLGDDEPGIALSLNGINRFYPFQILVWHEIVNDRFGDQRALVTYCPLCLSGIVFDPLVQGERVEFGTSGRLWNSNLVMYDRKTDSLWPQVLGEAVVGEMTGTKLAILPSDQTRFSNWKKVYPDGQVLSRETGAFRTYGADPYGDYYTTPGVYFPVSNRDSRLGEKELILGVVIDDQFKAYWPPAVKQAGTVRDSFAGKTIIAEYQSDLDVVQLFEEKTDGTRERINPFTSYWFAWAAAHPETELYQ